MRSEKRQIMPTLRRSLIAKIFLVSFLSVHVPLIALIIHLLSGFDTGPVPVFSLILGATLIGTAICLFAIWRFIRPLHHLAEALMKYPQDKSVLKLPSSGADEIAIVTDAAKSMLWQVEELTKKLKHQATTDFLTGLGNRRWLTEQLPAAQSQAERANEPLSLVLFDLDRFKQINDDYGHDIGDNVLMIVGEIVKDSLRPYDLASRIGGEEFCILLPRTSGEDAINIAERLRVAFEASYLDPLPKGRITCSFGVVQAATDERLQQLLRRADTALYRAKDAGRNTVIGVFADKSI